LISELAILLAILWFLSCYCGSYFSLFFPAFLLTNVYVFFKSEIKSSLHRLFISCNHLLPITSGAFSVFSTSTHGKRFFSHYSNFGGMTIWISIHVAFALVSHYVIDYSHLHSIRAFLFSISSTGQDYN
jgi:hypothetical protein